MSKNCVDEIAFWLSMDLQPYKTLINESWIPNYPVYRAQYVWKDIRLILPPITTPNILEQLRVAHEIHELKKHWE